MALASVRKRYRVKSNPNTFMGWMADYVDQAGARHSKLFKREKDAKAWLATVVVDVKAGVHTAMRNSITVGEAGEAWIEHRRDVEKLETATVRQYSNHLKHHINPHIGGVKLATLTAPDVAKFRDELLKTRSRVMVGKVLTSLKSILALAQEKGRISQNVAASVRLGQKHRRENRKLEIGLDIPTKDEIREILRAAENTRWHPLLATAALAGLRSSELRALRWQDVDLDGAIIHVRQRADEKNQMGAPKSAAGDRGIPLSPILVNILWRWRPACPPGALVFCNGSGNVENHANIVNRGWYMAQLRAGILDPHGHARYRFHACRHFFASVMIETNPLPKRLQQMMGHATLSMTMDRYGHLFPAGDDERTKVEKAASFLTEVASASMKPKSTLRATTV